MALDFNQRSFTKSVDQAAIDEGLRAYMLKVYNHMTIGRYHWFHSFFWESINSNK